MAKGNKSSIIKWKLLAIALIFVVIASTYFYRTQIEALVNGKSVGSGTKEDANSADFAVHYIDVGQGDATYIVLPNGDSMLIDAGPGKSEGKLISYLDGLGVQDITYLVLTHSDEDHVGGMDKVLENYAVSNIYRPFQIAQSTVSYPVDDPLAYYLEGEYSTRSVNSVAKVAYNAFIKLSYAEKDKDGNDALVVVFYEGLVIENAEAGYRFEFFAPRKYTEDVNAIGSMTTEDVTGQGYPTTYFADANNCSPFILLTYKDMKFAFSGDMEKKADDDMVSHLTDAQKSKLANVDVYKCGHHGSRTSSSEDILNITTPAYFVASCGKDNSYGHPHAELLTRVDNVLKSKYGSSEGRFYRTDESGDVIFYYGVSQDTIAAGSTEKTLLICCYNFKTTHYFTWFEMAGGVFVVCVVVILCIGGSKSTYKKAKKYIKRK